MTDQPTKKPYVKPALKKLPAAEGLGNSKTPNIFENPTFNQRDPATS